ncbi:hypothetical protein D3C79_1040280 [compost metagenome]
MQVDLGLAAAGNAGQEERIEAAKAIAHGLEGHSLFFVERQFRLGQPVLMALIWQVAAYFELNQVLGQ